MGVDRYGEDILDQQTTEADGTFAFIGLPPAQYTLTEVQPRGYDNHKQYAGSEGGDISVEDSISGIDLAQDTDATDYIFGDHFVFVPTPVPSANYFVLLILGLGFICFVRRRA